MGDVDRKKRYIPDDYTEKPIEAAHRWVKHLLGVLREDIDTFIFAASINRRRGKLLLALRQIKIALSMNPSHPQLLYEIFCFIKQIETQDPSPDDLILSNVDKKELLAG